MDSCSVLKAFYIIIDRIYWCFFVFYGIRRGCFFVFCLYVIHHVSDLFYGICINNKLTKSNRKSLLFTDVSNPIWYLLRSDLVILQSFNLLNHNIMISILLLLECISRSSSVFSEETKLTFIVNWIFHAADYLRLFIMPFIYGLFLSRYSLIDKVLFPAPLPSYST